MVIFDDLFGNQRQEEAGTEERPQLHLRLVDRRWKRPHQAEEEQADTQRS